MRLRFLTFLAALFASLAIAAPAFAVGSIFVVRGVDVEATGESGPKACEAAYGQGQDRAWKKLIERVVPEAGWAAVPQPPAEQLNEFVAGYEVSGEKRSNTKCVATMTYLFKADLVKKYLRERGVSYADRRGPATLAIPLYETPGGTRLWGDDNLWLNAFKVVKLENELIPVEAPYGDDGDKAAIPPGASLGTDWLTYKTIADKYGMKAVLVARATYAAGTVTVEADLVSEAGSEHFSATGTGADERGALANAVRTLAAAMGESWKAAAAIDNSISAAISVWAPYNSLAQRNDIEQRLRKIQNILDVNVSRVTTSGMAVSLRYRGRNDQFEQALRQAGFGIYPSSSSGGGLVLDAYRAGVPMSFGGGAAANPDDEAQPPPPPPEEEPPVEQPQVIRPQ
ncbi:hypothetical protein sos41_28020 [Alphaproteobacteria bacterium SO-S41]|nr:hypothetical protein sos41_28020 [Alphaproteobacteria bacterium SO-S41]